jgi:hypothetical protein
MAKKRKSLKNRVRVFFKSTKTWVTFKKKRK